MEENTITITVKEYRELLEKPLRMSERIMAFADYVNGEKYGIPREICGRLLGFDVKQVEG